MTLLRLPAPAIAERPHSDEATDVLAELLNDEAATLLARIDGLRAGASADRCARLDELQVKVTRLAEVVAASAGVRRRTGDVPASSERDRERALFLEQLSASSADPRLLARTPRLT